MDENLKTQIEKYKKTKWEDLLREDLGKNYHLKELKPTLDFIKKFLDEIINSSNLAQLHNEHHNLKRFLELFEDLKTTIKNHDRVGANQEIINETVSFKSNLVNELSQLLYLVRLYESYAESEDISSPKDFTTIAQAEIKKFRDSCKKAMQDVEKIKTTYQGAVQGDTAKRYGDFFKIESEKNDGQAFWAMFFLVLLSISSIFIASVSTIDKNIQVNNIAELIVKGEIINKVFIFSVLLLLINWLKRKDFAFKHLSHLNMHRHNALSSHKEVLNSIKETESESDKEIANAILLELTKSMFTPQETGFLASQKIILLKIKLLKFHGLYIEKAKNHSLIAP